MIRRRSGTPMGNEVNVKNLITYNIYAPWLTHKLNLKNLRGKGKGPKSDYLPLHISLIILFV